MSTRRTFSVPRGLCGIFFVLFGLLGAGCSFFSGEDETADRTTTTSRTESEDDSGGATTIQPAPTTTESVTQETEPGDLFELLGPEDRIVVQTTDNNLSILTFGGVVPGPTESDATQPVFSSDGSVLVWSRINANSGRGELIFADVGSDGSLSGQTAVPTPVVSFYSVFAPGSSDRVAVLGNSSRGVGVAVVDRSGESTPVLDQGVPYYFVWSSDGSGFLGHVGTRLREFDLESGSGVDGGEVLPSFRTPGLLGDGTAVYVATENTAGSVGFSSIDRIESTADGFDSGSARSVARFDGLGSLSLSPDSSRLAVVVEGTLTDARVSNSPTNPARFQAGEALDRGLHLINTETDEIQTLVSGPVIAAFWAPNSELIASLAYDSIGEGRSWVRWTVLDTEGQVISRSPRLLMSRLFATSYLPFYDQFEQSTTPWSPDSTRLVFPGESMAGDAGIWLHQTPMAGEGAQTFLIGDGLMALWSP